MEQMKLAAKQLEHQLERLYIVISAASVVSVCGLGFVAFWRFGWTSFGVIMAAGVSLIILIVASGILDYKKNKYKTQTLLQLLESQTLNQNEQNEKNPEQNQSTACGLDETENGLISPEKMDDLKNNEQIQDVKENVVNTEIQQSDAITPEMYNSDSSKQIQSVTCIFTDYLSENSQEYELSLALFKNVRTVRKSLFAKAD